MLIKPSEHLEDMGIAGFCISEVVEDEEYSDDIWDWLDDIASFKHVSAKEYMVYIDKETSIPSLEEYLKSKTEHPLPKILMPILQEAYEQGYSYVNFYPC